MDDAGKNKINQKGTYGMGVIWRWLGSGVLILFSFIIKEKREDAEKEGGGWFEWAS